MSDFLTFIGGAAVGTFITYLTKNEEARKSVERFIDSAGQAFTDFLRRVTPVSSGQASDSTAGPERKTAKKGKPAGKPAQSRRTAKAQKTTRQTSIH